MDPMGLEYLAKWPNVHLAVDNQKDPLPSQVSVDSWNPTLASFLQTNIWRWSQGSSPDPHSTWDHHYWCLNHLKSFDAYITIFHIFHGQLPLFEYAKAVVFVFGSLVSAPKQKRAGLDLPFPAGLGDSLCYLPHPAGPLEPRPGSLQCLLAYPLVN